MALVPPIYWHNIGTAWVVDKIVASQFADPESRYLQIVFHIKEAEKADGHVM